MRKISLKKAGIFAMIVAMPLVVFAQTTPNATEIVKQLQTLLNQYSEKIRVLEAENAFLKEKLAGNNVTIPLDELNAAIEKAKTSSVSGSTATALSTTTTNTAITSTVVVPKANPNAGNNDLQKGFIKQFRADWPDIRKAYSMPEDAYIGMYEFVKNDAGNNVFVNIVYGDGTPEGAYNAKLLYSFDKITFKRTLIGFFLYSSESKGYRTLRGTNPFANVERERVMESGTSSVATTTENATTEVLTTSAATATEIENKMREAYLAKNYAQVFTISDAYLKNNKATYLMYFHRYRSYYAQGKYSDALNEIKKMETAKLADARIYCDAYAINYVVRNTTAANNYKNLAGAGCKLTP